MASNISDLLSPVGTVQEYSCDVVLKLEMSTNADIHPKFADGSINDLGETIQYAGLATQPNIWYQAGPDIPPIQDIPLPVSNSAGKDQYDKDVCDLDNVHVSESTRNSG
jgi:hypothetical protein